MIEEYAFYKAIKQLKEAAKADPELRALMDAVAAVGGEEINAEAVFAEADAEWIKKVTDGLDAIGRALDEERRFIRSEGEVLPIEKVKRVSKESVQHLARRSDCINREKSGEEIVPDKLLTVERLNDYATYENRFLYTLLCMLKEYTAEKLSKLLGANSYEGTLNVHKKVKLGTRRLSVDLKLKDERDGFKLTVRENIAAIERLEQSIDYYLRTPLMTEVAKADKIKSLTLTNVLKMNKNFREAVALYEYILSDKDEKLNTSVQKWTAADSFELALPAVLYAFAVYGGGPDIGGELKKNYHLAEEKLLKEKRLALGNTLGGKKAEEYILLLEEKNAELSGEIKELAAARRRLAEQDKLIEELERAAESERLGFEQTVAEYKAQSEKAAEQYEVRSAQNLKRLQEIAEQCENLRSKAEELIAENSNLIAQNKALEAIIVALRADRGEIAEGEFASEEGLDKLESLYETLGRLLNSEWKGVKRALKEQSRAEIIRRIFGKRGSARPNNNTVEEPSE